MRGLIVLQHGDGEHPFRLSIGGIDEIEERFDLSVFTLADRLRARTALRVHVQEILRVGLIGGGMTPLDALAHCRRYCDERPLDESRDVALAVVLMGLSRIEPQADAGEAPGEPLAPVAPSGLTPVPSSAAP